MKIASHHKAAVAEAMATRPDLPWAESQPVETAVEMLKAEVLPSLASGIRSGIRLPDGRPISYWAEDGVSLPHSKRTKGMFRRDTAPWLNVPLDCCNDPSVNFMSLCKPTQSGGTTLYEVYLCWLIANNPSDALLTCQTDDDATDLFRTKILPSLRQSPGTKNIIAAAGRDDVTKDKLRLGSMFLRVQGPSIANLQSVSAEVLLCDEVWRFELGVMTELTERTSTVEARRKIISVSQASQWLVDKKGKPFLDEWGAWWHRGTQEVYNVRCPHCRELFEPVTECVRWDDTAATRNPETKEWIWKAVKATVRMECPHCTGVIPNTDHARRSLSESGEYVQTNFNAEDGHRSFRYSAWVVYWQNWATLVEMYLRAQDDLKRGQIEKYKQFVQKKECRFWEIKDSEIPVLNNRPPSGFVIADYEPKEGEKDVPRIDGEIIRTLTCDYQSNRFPAVVQAFRADASARVLYAGNLGTWSDVEGLRRKYRIPSAYVGIDANWLPQAVYAACRDRGYTALIGSKANRFVHIKNKQSYELPYSELRKGYIAAAKRGQKNYAPLIYWSNRIIKDILARIINGAGVPWDFPDDILDEFIKTLESEVKNPKTGIWEEANAYNHLRDCLNMSLVLVAQAPLFLLGDLSAEAAAAPATDGEEQAAA